MRLLHRYRRSRRTFLMTPRCMDRTTPRRIIGRFLKVIPLAKQLCATKFGFRTRDGYERHRCSPAHVRGPVMVRCAGCELIGSTSIINIGWIQCGQPKRRRRRSGVGEGRQVPRSVFPSWTGNVAAAAKVLPVSRPCRVWILALDARLENERCVATCRELGIAFVVAYSHWGAGSDRGRSNKLDLDPSDWPIDQSALWRKRVATI